MKHTTVYYITNTVYLCLMNAIIKDVENFFLWADQVYTYACTKMIKNQSFARVSLLKSAPLAMCSICQCYLQKRYVHHPLKMK